MKCKPLSEEPIIETLKVMQSIGIFVQSMLYQLYAFMVTMNVARLKAVMPKLVLFHRD